MRLISVLRSKLRATCPNERKRLAELDYWRNLMADLTKNCRDPAERSEELMRVCREITHPRYKQDLYLEADSLKGKRVLDLGCGPHGGLIGFKDCDRYGVDHLIDEYVGIGYPLAEHQIKYYQAKSESLPFPDRFFDVVVCVNALDHVDSLQKTIKEISRVLKGGGIFRGQINFHSRPTVTEPITLNHKALIALLLRHDLVVTRRLFQRKVGQEDRYYYECVRT